MASIIQSASLCPLRSTPEGLLVLLVRRAFWNYQKQRPMRYPGEWAFPGGVWEEGDANLVATAVREFREELQYAGPVTDTRLLRSEVQESHGKQYYGEFHAARIDHAFPFALTDEGEVMNVQWITPAAALSRMRSEEFEREQLEEYRHRGLGGPAFGVYAAVGRQFPTQNVKTLETILSMPDLKDVY